MRQAAVPLVFSHALLLGRPAAPPPDPLVILAALLLGAPAHARDEVVVRDETSSPALDGVRTVSVDVPVGDLHVLAGGSGGAEAHMELRCNGDSPRCKQRAADIHLVATRDGDRLLLKV